MDTTTLALSPFWVDLLLLAGRTGNSRSAQRIAAIGQNRCGTKRQ